MKNYNPQISIWQDSILSLPDKEFFNLIKLYLGEIKTPYNKQRLIEQLAGFIKNENNISVILSFLDSFDLEILCVISLIEKADKNKLFDFFKDKYSYSSLYTKLMNLQERLIIFQTNLPLNNQPIFKINPLMQSNIEPYINLSRIIPLEIIEKASTEDNFLITPTFIASFISYIQIKGCSGKADGNLKKSEKSFLEEIFNDKADCIQLLLSAFINLSIIFEGPKKFEINKQKLKAFSNLTFEQQYSLICISSNIRWGKESLQKQSQFFLDFLYSIPQTGLTKNSLFRLAFIIKNLNSTDSSDNQSRFSRILQAAKKDENSSANDNSSIIDLAIDSAIKFGLLQEYGTNSEGNEIYIRNKSIDDAVINTEKSDSPKVLNINSTYSVSIMPGLSLNQLLPLMSFLSIKKSGLVSEFEITRQSVSVAFNDDYTPEELFSELQKYTYYELPQNLLMNVTEWYNSYSSAVIYKGFVLKVKEENITFVEKNPNIQKYIQNKLGNGVYLLNIPIDENISPFLRSCGLDFMGNVKTPEIIADSIPFPTIKRRNSINLAFDKTDKDIAIETKKGIGILQELKSKLELSDFTENQKESLSIRLRNKLILSEKQLLTSSIRSEIQEAEGMDYNGKIHLLETAIKEDTIVEIHLPYFNTNDAVTFIGKPLQVNKQTGDAILTLRVEPTEEVESIKIRMINHLKLLKY